MATEVVQDRRSFLERRRSGIGGSDVGALIGVHPFGKTAVDVFEEKLGRVAVSDTLTPPQERGIVLEPIIADQYQRMTGFELVTPNMTFRHPEKPYILAHPDRLVVSQWAMLEVKAPGLEQFGKLKYEGISQQYQCQAQHYFLVLGAQMKWLDFRFFNAERWQGINVRQEPDPYLMARIEEICDQFWHDHVLKENPPSSDSFYLDLPEAETSIVEIKDEERLEALAKLRRAKDLKKQIEQMEQEAVGHMKTLLGATGTYIAEGEEAGRVHKLVFYETDGRRTFDDKYLASVGALDPAEVQRIIISQLSTDEGRVNATTSFLIESLKHARLNLEKFYKQGEKFSTLRLYPNAKR